MKTKSRILLALALFVALVVAGIGPPAWAAKLSLSAQAPAASGPQLALPVGSRVQGTVFTTYPVVELTSDVQATVGSCATVLVKHGPSGVHYTAFVVPGRTLPGPFPGLLMSCGIKIEAVPGPTLGAEVRVCFPILPWRGWNYWGGYTGSGPGYAYDWDGANWVRTTLDTMDNQSCVDIPAKAANLVFAGLFDR